MYLANQEQGNYTIADAQKGRQEVESQSNEAADMMNLPQEVLLVFKRIQKKDPITKCKAFKELDDYLDQMDSKSP